MTSWNQPENYYAQDKDEALTLQSIEGSSPKMRPSERETGLFAKVGTPYEKGMNDKRINSVEHTLSMPNGSCLEGPFSSSFRQQLSPLGVIKPPHESLLKFGDTIHLQISSKEAIKGHAHEQTHEQANEETSQAMDVWGKSPLIKADGLVETVARAYTPKNKSTFKNKAYPDEVGCSLFVVERVKNYVDQVALEGIELDIRNQDTHIQQLPKMKKLEGLIEAAKLEREKNRTLDEVSLGKPVTVGSPIQLRHLRSKKYLSLVPSERGLEVRLKEGSECAELVIDLLHFNQINNVPLSFKEFFTLRGPPHRHSKFLGFKEDASLRHHYDKIQEEHFKGNKDFKDQFFALAGHNTFIVAPCTEPFQWKAKLFQDWSMACDLKEGEGVEVEAAIKIGDIVELGHRELNCILGSPQEPLIREDQNLRHTFTFTCNKNLRTVKAGKSGKVVFGENQVGTWWEIVGVNRQGGFVTHGSSIRLRNLATGRFLDFSNILRLKKKGEDPASTLKIFSEMGSSEEEKICHQHTVYLLNPETGILHIVRKKEDGEHLDGLD